MAEKKITEAPPVFAKENLRWILIGVIVIALGMFLMTGGKSDNPAVFDRSQVYSTTRITIAPLVILAGLVIEMFAIFRKRKTEAV